MVQQHLERFAAKSPVRSFVFSEKAAGIVILTLILQAIIRLGKGKIG